MIDKSLADRPAPSLERPWVYRRRRDWGRAFEIVGTFALSWAAALGLAWLALRAI